MKSGIYAITHCQSGRVYVGSSKNIKRRFSDHRYRLKANIHDNQYLQNAWNKYEEAQFAFEVIEHCVEDELLEKEQFWIDVLGAHKSKCGFNMNPLAGSNVGYRHSEASKQKMSEFHKNRALDPVVKNQLQTGFLGRKHSEESRKQMSETRKSRELTEKQIDGIKRSALKRIGMKHGDQAKSKISKANKGRRMSEETRRKMSQTHTGLKRSEETKQKMREAWVIRKQKMKEENGQASP